MGGVKANDRIGSVVARSYKLVRVLGEGGMGTVYEAEHTRVPRKFAVKVLKAECAADREMFERFRREAQIASSIGHENIVEALDFDILEDGAPYIILEHLEGEHLGARIGRRGRLSVEETIDILDDTASALDAAHDKGIVHRDLKPQNLFLIHRGKRDDFVKVLDFGISKVLHDPQLATRDGIYLGTPNYMAPEQLSAEHGEIDRRSDIWALAAIAYECLSGRLAFSGPTTAGTLLQVVHGQPVPLRTYAPAVPEAVVKVIARGLAKRPDDRFATARELRDALLGAVGRPVTVGRMPTLALGITPKEDVPPPNPGDISLEPTQIEALPALPPRPDTLQATAALPSIELPAKRSRTPLVAAAALVAALAIGAFALSRTTAPQASTATTTSAPPPPPPSAAPSTVPMAVPTQTASASAPSPTPSSSQPVAPSPIVHAPTTKTATKTTAAPAAKSAAPTAQPKTGGGIDIGPREKDL